MNVASATTAVGKSKTNAQMVGRLLKKLWRSEREEHRANDNVRQSVNVNGDEYYSRHYF